MALPARTTMGMCPADMTKTPAGTYQMGSKGSFGDKHSRPRHKVRVRTFCLDTYEFTYGVARDRLRDSGDKSHQMLFWKIMARTKISLPNEPPLVLATGDKKPVNNVTWFLADKVCRALGKRLPTEAEWELAARGKRHRDYFATVDGKLKSEKGEKQANYFNGYEISAANSGINDVGSYGPNNLGLYDLTGNVSEWVADWFGRYPKKFQKNPKGPSKGKHRVTRGGSWYGDTDIGSERFLLVTTRFKHHPSDTFFDVGFRCAMDLPGK